MALTQANRFLNLETPLGKDKLLLNSFAGQEQISGLFHFQLEMVSEELDIQPAKIVGKNVTFGVHLADKSIRYFNGFVQSFTAGDQDKSEKQKLRYYSADVLPWFWFLTRTTDCRIFQKKKTPDIVQQIFRDLGFNDFELKLNGAYREREYCVQYRESDFNFVSRLLEEEGMFYFFKHEQGKHTMVIGDSFTAYETCKESEVDYPRDFSNKAIDDHITSWEHRYEFHTGKWAQTDYNFETPSASLMTKTQTRSSHVPDAAKYEAYDYPGLYLKTGDGQPLTDARIEEEETPHDVIHAASNCKTFTSGAKFKVKQHRSDSEAGKKVVITSIRHAAKETMAYDTGNQVDSDYSNTFTCIPDNITHRPERVSRKPFVQGIQTAVVVGPAGEEIYCDKYGRVKVQFYWDREGQKDQDSSCFIRCSQDVAGKTWGFMAIPRIGQEVVVDFLEGDPDRPLITGCVYNAEQMPAYKLPDEKTKTYIKTNSSSGGNGFNEIRFEDKAGEEQVFIHAQKDMDERVKEVSREYIGTDRHLLVGGNQKEQVGGDKHLMVKGKQSEEIKGKMSLKVGGDRHTKVGMVDTTEAGQEIHLKGGMKVVIEAGMQISLVGPGGFVDIGPAGVTIQGIMVKINSGGSAGSGTSASPDAPEAPDEADDAKTGMKSN